MEVYLDNASTTKMSKKAIEAMLPYFREIYGNASSLHNLGQKAKESLIYARESIAKMLNCEAKEIIFTSCGSESDNQAILSIAKQGLKNNKKHIITSNIEHHAVLDTLKELEKQGFIVTYLKVKENGIIDINDLKDAIKKDTCLVTIMYANNEIGTIQPIKEIGQICKDNNIIFHTDAVQAVGNIKIDVKEQNIDMLSLSAHKFNGPKGIGLLYYKKGIILEKLIKGGEQERNKRAGTENIASIIGMKVALEENLSKIDLKNEKMKYLQDKLIDGLSKIPYSYLNGDRYDRLKNNVNFCFEGVEGESLLLLLNEKGIYCSSGSACTSGSMEPSYVIMSIGRNKEIAQSSLRLTLSMETSEVEIDYTIKTIKEVVEYLREMSPIWHNKKEAIKI